MGKRANGDVSRRLQNYEDAVYLYAHSAVRSGLDFDDVCQELRIAATRALTRYEEGRGVKESSFVITVIRNQMLTLVGKHKRRSKKEIAVDMGSLHIAENDPHIDNMLDLSVLHAVDVRVRAVAPEAVLQLWDMLYNRNLSVIRAAGELGITVGWAYKLFAQIRSIALSVR